MFVRNHACGKSQSRIDKAFRIGFQQKPFITQTPADNVGFIVICTAHTDIALKAQGVKYIAPVLTSTEKGNCNFFARNRKNLNIITKSL